MVEILGNGGELKGKYKDMYNNGGYAEAVDKALAGSNEVSQKVQKHLNSSMMATGRVGEIAAKMSKTRRSLAQGGELNIQAGNYTQVTGTGKNRKGGLRVRMENQQTLADKKKKSKPNTVVITEGQKVKTQGSGKSKTKSVLNDRQQTVVEKSRVPKIVDAKGKEVPITRTSAPTMPTRIVDKAPVNEVLTENPNRTIHVTNTTPNKTLQVTDVPKNTTRKTTQIVDNKKKAAEIKNAAKKGLSTKSKIGIGLGAAALLGTGGGYLGYQTYKKRKENNEKN